MEDKLAMLPTLLHTSANCALVFDDDFAAIKLAKRIREVTNISDAEYIQLASDCEAFRERGYMTVPVNAEEEHFPIGMELIK